MIAGSTGALILLSNIFASCSQVRPLPIQTQMSGSASGENVSVDSVLSSCLELAHSPNPLIFLRPITHASEISLTSSGRQWDSLTLITHQC